MGGAELSNRKMGGAELSGRSEFREDAFCILCIHVCTILLTMGTYRFVILAKTKRELDMRSSHFLSLTLPQAASCVCACI